MATGEPGDVRMPARQAVMLGPRHVAYLDAGVPDGRVLLLLHAFPLSAEMWRPQLEAPPPGWRVVAPDFAGLGRSDDRESDSVSLDDYATDVIGLADRLAIPQMVVAGLSLGGYVALALARLAPDRLSGLVLADTKAPGDSPEARAGREKMLATLSERGAGGVSDEMLPRLLGATTRRDRPDVVAEVRSLILTNNPEGIRHAILRLRDRPDATPVLPRIEAPALVLVGEEDEVTPLAEAQRLQQGIAGARLETLPAAGHLSNMERPEAFTAALTRFLSTL
jgi:3-oxoadipate enol-lactonase